MFLEESFFDNVTEEEISDIAISLFGFYAPNVYKFRTPKGNEYFHIEGIRYGDNGAESAFLDLDYYGPVMVRKDGNLLLNLESVYSNLEACKQYIHFMDSKNIGVSCNGGSYTMKVRGLFNIILKEMDRVKNCCELERA